MTELLTLMHIRDMHLNDRTLQAANAVLQGDARMGLGTSIEYNAVVAAKKARFLHLID